MKKVLIGIVILVLVIGVVAILVGSSAVDVWNRLNRNYQTTEGAKSRYSAALAT